MVIEKSAVRLLHAPDDSAMLLPINSTSFLSSAGTRSLVALDLLMRPLGLVSLLAAVLGGFAQNDIDGRATSAADFTLRAHTFHFSQTISRNLPSSLA